LPGSCRFKRKLFVCCFLFSLLLKTT